MTRLALFRRSLFTHPTSIGARSTHLCQFLVAMITLALLQPVNVDAHDGPECERTQARAATPEDELESLCGWVDTCTFDQTETKVSLSTPLPVAATAPSSLPSAEATATVIASAACASAGVQVEQILEPFAMVGPYVQEPSQSVMKFQQWWERALSAAKRIQVAETSCDPSPVNLGQLGPSVLRLSSHRTDTSPSQDERASVTDRRSPASRTFLGTAPVVVTLEEAYLPYDMSAGDLAVWSALPMNTQPFCIRSQHEPPDTIWRAFHEALESDFVETAATIADEQVEDGPQPDEAPDFVQLELKYGSADCILDDWIWRWDQWRASDSWLSAAIEPRNVGAQVAFLASRTAGVARNAAKLLAMHWPKPPAQAPAQPELKPEEISPTGAALLARAGAVLDNVAVVTNADQGNDDANVQVTRPSDAGAQVATVPSDVSRR